MLRRALLPASLLLLPVLVALPGAQADFVDCRGPYPTLGYVCVLGNTRSEGQGSCNASPTYYDGTRSVDLIVGSGSPFITYVTVWGGCYYDQGAPSSGVQVIVSKPGVAHVGAGWGGREGGLCETRLGLVFFVQDLGCPVGRPPSVEPPAVPLVP